MLTKYYPQVKQYCVYNSIAFFAYVFCIIINNKISQIIAFAANPQAVEKRQKSMNMYR